MIELKRPEIIPPTLREGGKGGVARREHESKLELDPEVALEFEPYWTETDVHGALLAMQGWVCAYCQRKIDPADPKYVDHFRPKKGGYGWLAYVFRNYFLTCSRCNTRKGEQFPIHEGEKLRFATRDKWREEARLLIDPSADPVTQWLSLDVSEARYAEISARSLDPSSLAAHRVKATVEIFELNDDYRHLQRRVRFLNKLTNLHKKGKLRKLSRRAIRYRPHSLAARCFLEAYAPELLPDAASELRWFLKMLCKELTGILDVRRRRSRGSGASYRDAREIAWTLAYLWRSPPVGKPEDVARFLDEMDCRKLVERYYHKLG